MSFFVILSEAEARCAGRAESKDPYSKFADGFE